MNLCVILLMLRIQTVLYEYTTIVWYVMDRYGAVELLLMKITDLREICEMDTMKAWNKMKFTGSIKR